MAKIKVLEVSQWMSTGGMELFSFADFDENKLIGRDIETIKKLGMLKSSVKFVDFDASPPLGKVWYAEKTNGKTKGKLFLYKQNLDTSG